METREKPSLSSFFKKLLSRGARDQQHNINQGNTFQLSEGEIFDYYIKEYRSTISNIDRPKIPYVGTTKEDPRMVTIKKGNSGPTSYSKLYPDKSREYFFQGLTYLEKQPGILFDRNHFFGKNQNGFKHLLQENLCAKFKSIDITTDDINDFMKNYASELNFDQEILNQVHPNTWKRNKDNLFTTIQTAEAKKFIEEFIEMIKEFKDCTKIIQLSFKGAISINEEHHTDEGLHRRINFVVSVMNRAVRMFVKMMNYRYSRENLKDAVLNKYYDILIPAYNKHVSKINKPQTNTNNTINPHESSIPSKIIPTTTKRGSIDLNDMINNMTIKEQEQTYTLFNFNNTIERRTIKSLLYCIFNNKIISHEIYNSLNEFQKVFIDQLQKKYKKTDEVQKNSPINNLDETKDKINKNNTDTHPFLTESQDVQSYEQFVDIIQKIGLHIGSDIKANYEKLFSESNKQRLDVVQDFCHNMTRAYLGLPSYNNPKKYDAGLYIYRSKKNKQGIRFRIIKQQDGNWILAKILDHDEHEEELRK